MKWEKPENKIETCYFYHVMNSLNQKGTKKHQTK